MPVITIFSGSYCNAEEVAQKIAVDLGYQLIDDQAIMAEASKRFQIEESKLARAIAGKASVFNKFTHEKERSLACLKVVLADWLKQDDLLFLGFLGQLIPRDISHVLKVCIIAELKYRTRVAADAEGLSEKEALKRIHKDDETSRPVGGTALQQTRPLGSRILRYRDPDGQKQRGFRRPAHLQQSSKRMCCK